MLRLTAGLLGSCFVLMTLCSPDAPAAALSPHPVPLIIAHRGLPGLYPEEVIAAYEAAIAAGADALELDLQSSSDGVLFACHNVYLSDTTDVASHPEFASRRPTGMRGARRSMSSHSIRKVSSCCVAWA